MVKKTSSSKDTSLALATLKLAAARDWDKVTLDAVASAAKISKNELGHRFKSSNDLVSLIASEIDKQAFKEVEMSKGSAHDVLFDIVMARFDVLQKHRVAILNMAKHARRDRLLIAALARATFETIYRMIDFSKLTKPQRPILALGLLVIYSWTFVVWSKDQSADMAKAMAALDRSLKLASKLISFIPIKDLS